VSKDGLRRALLGARDGRLAILSASRIETAGFAPRNDVLRLSRLSRFEAVSPVPRQREDFAAKAVQQKSGPCGPLFRPPGYDCLADAFLLQSALDFIKHCRIIDGRGHRPGIIVGDLFHRAAQDFA
jgi:hypothetical protein